MLERPFFRPVLAAPSGDVAFALARMFEMLRDSEGGIRVFGDLNEALEWVLAKRTVR